MIGKWSFASTTTGFNEIPFLKCTINFIKNRTYEQQCIGIATEDDGGKKLIFIVKGIWDFNENDGKGSFYMLKPKTVSARVLSKTNATEDDLKKLNQKENKNVSLPQSALVIFSIKSIQSNLMVINVKSSTENEYATGEMNLKGMNGGE